MIGIRSLKEEPEMMRRFAVGIWPLALSLGIVTGGSPRTAGAFYDVAYDRSLQPPALATGNGLAAGSCTPGQIPTGTSTEYEEGIDFDQTQLNGGAPSGDGGANSIDTRRLPRDPANDCLPVLPPNFLRGEPI